MGKKFVSAKRHVHRKDAEEDAATVAYKALVGDETIDTLIELTNKRAICKINLLKEYVQKKRLSDPAYSDAVYESSKVAVRPFGYQLSHWTDKFTWETSPSQSDCQFSRLLLRL
jgi:hypothetical protein